MPKTTTSTTVEYTVDEFIALIREKIFDGKEIKLAFKIEEVGGDPLDLYPGTDTVTQVQVTFDGSPT